jgi:hypothetical protein
VLSKKKTVCISTACAIQKKINYVHISAACVIKKILIVCISAACVIQKDINCVHICSMYNQLYFYPGEQSALEDIKLEFGVYTETVDIAFDEEELSDSDDVEDQQTYDEEEDTQAHDVEEDDQAYDVDDDQTHHDQARNRTTDLTNRQIRDIFEDLLQSSKNGKFKRNSITIIAVKYNVRIRTIQRVWKRAKKMLGIGHTSKYQWFET